PWVLALRLRQAWARLALEPDIGVEPGLMAGMARRSGPAARLADVADIEMGLTRGTHLLRQGLDEVDGDRLAPITGAAETDRLVAGALERQSLCALQTARGVEADGLGRTRGGRRHL